MKILITGVCGFVGSSLAKNWLEAEPGLTLYGLDNFVRPGSEYNRGHLQKSGVKLFHGDIRVASDLEGLPPVDWVIDAAANPSVLSGVDGQVSSRQLVEHNLLGTLNVLEYCKKHRAGFIMLSSSRVYSLKPLAEMAVESYQDTFRLTPNQLLPVGMSSAGLSEAFSTSPPISLYGSSKLASETLALEYGETFGFPVWINRCGILAGAGQFGRADQGIFAYWINAWLRRHPLTYTGFGGRGHQVRDCLHPRDLLQLLRIQTTCGDTSRIRVTNIGGGVNRAMSLAQLSGWCAEHYGTHSVGSEPEARRFDIPWLIMDSSLAHTQWGWQPRIPLNEILEEIALHAELHPDWLELSRQPVNCFPENMDELQLLSVVIPARDEEECVCSTIERLHRELHLQNIPHEIVVVDDGSTDRTWELLQELSQRLHELRPVQNSGPHGFGRAVVAGLDTMAGDAVVIMMADESDSCKDVVRYWQELNKGFDCVFGSRFIEGGKTIDYPPLKFILNRLANTFLRFLFRIRLNDTTNAFKAYRREAIDGCCPLISPHFNLTVELPLKAIIRGFSWTTVPITWSNRRSGAAKFKIKEMGSRYLFICLYIWLEKYFSCGDYRKKSIQP